MSNKSKKHRAAQNSVFVLHLTTKYRLEKQYILFRVSRIISFYPTMNPGPAVSLGHITKIGYRVYKIITCKMLTEIFIAFQKYKTVLLVSL